MCFRAQPGARVCVFDGRGGEYQAEVVKLERRVARLAVIDFEDVDRELPFRLQLAVAMPRGDRQDWLTQKAVEVGVTQLIPWQTERSVARPNAKTLKRFSRGVIEASKQCRRNRLMDIVAPVDFGSFVATAWPGPRLLAHAGPAAISLLELVGQFPNQSLEDSGIQLGIGPEGGFTDGEVQLAADHGWQAVRLGQPTLRTETAAIVASAHLALLFRKRRYLMNSDTARSFVGVILDGAEQMPPDITVLPGSCIAIARD